MAMGRRSGVGVMVCSVHGVRAEHLFSAVMTMMRTVKIPDPECMEIATAMLRALETCTEMAQHSAAVATACSARRKRNRAMTMTWAGCTETVLGR